MSSPDTRRRYDRPARLAAAAVFGAVAAGLAACADAPETTPEAGAGAGWRLDPGGDLNAFFDCLEAEGATLASAHRGGSYPGLPENALETMVHVLAQAPAIVEFDVAAASDGVLFLMHDDTLERTTTGAGRADAAPYAEIAKLRLKDRDGSVTRFAPPRFAEVLSALKDRTVVQIDFKRSARYEDVIDEVKRQNADDQVIYIAYSFAAAQKLHRLHPEAMISLSVNGQSDLNRAVAAGVPADRLVAFTGTEAPRPRLFNVLNDRAVEVIFGTLGGRGSIDKAIARAGDEARYAQIARDGADVIATDRPLEAHAALAAAGRAAEAGECGISGPAAG
ncbi:MAG: glycerophosphodiester phosphodiesterase family protein [Pseudomonadota bacterium]